MHVSCVELFVTPWTVAHQTPLSSGFSRQEYWSGLPFPPPGNLPDPGIEPESPAALTLAGGFFTTEPSGKPWHNAEHIIKMWMSVLLQLVRTFQTLKGLP